MFLYALMLQYTKKFKRIACSLATVCGKPMYEFDVQAFTFMNLCISQTSYISSISRVLLTSYPVLHSATILAVMVSSFNYKQLYWIKVLWQLQTVLRLPKCWCIIILIHYCNVHFGLCIVRGHPSISGIHCITYHRHISRRINMTEQAAVSFLLHNTILMLNQQEPGDYQLCCNAPDVPCQGFW